MLVLLEEPLLRSGGHMIGRIDRMVCRAMPWNEVFWVLFVGLLAFPAGGVYFMSEAKLRW